MPLTRYQIRNEYSLADPELYRAADKDDPEAILEGVAMAGLVGVLRQLGDLAEFAAEIFHDLHEEVMATAARGHGLMVRVQQLETDFPSLEKAFLSQTSQSLFVYNTGIDWHPNHRMDQNLITQGDLPRFVMDSYEECRGPPRLFLLDKFDIAGAGACLKRYTDPSFFKVESSSSGMTKKAEVQREKKTRKAKKKGSRWRNGETPEVQPTSHAKLHQLFLEESVENYINDPARHVKLKRRLNGFPLDSKTGKSYMEKLLKNPTPDHNVVRDISVNSSPLRLPSNINVESGIEIHEVSTVNPGKELPWRKRSPFSSPDAEETGRKPSINELNEDVNYGISEVLKLNPISEADNVHEDVDEQGREADGERKIGDSVDGYQSDDIASEVDNYMDALTTMDSEMEADIEYKAKNDLHNSNTENQGTDSDANVEQKDLQAHFSDSQSIGNSTATDDEISSSRKGISSFSCSESPSNLAENTPSDGDVSVKNFPSTGTCEAEILNMSSDQQSVIRESPSNQAAEHPCNGVCTKEANIPNYRLEHGQPSSSAFLSDSTIVILPVDPGKSSTEGAIAELDEISSDRNEINNESSSPKMCLTFPGDDLPCTSNHFSPERSSENHSVDELDNEDPHLLSHASLHLSDIWDLAPGKKSSENSLDDLLQAENAEDGCPKVSFDNQIDSSHSVASHTQEKLLDSALPEPESWLADIKPDGIVSEADNAPPLPGERAISSIPIVDSPQATNFTKQQFPGISENVAPLKLDPAEVVFPFCGERNLDNASNATDGEELGDFSSDKAIFEKDAAEVKFPSDLLSPDPSSVPYVHLDDVTTESSQTEFMIEATAVAGTHYGDNADIGKSLSRSPTELQEEPISIFQDVQENVISEGCSIEHLQESDTKEEADQQGVASSSLDSVLCSAVSCDDSKSEVLNNVPDSAMAALSRNSLPIVDDATVPLSLDQHDQPSESKSAQLIDLTEDAGDVVTSPTHNFAEVRPPLERKVELQDDRFDVGSWGGQDDMQTVCALSRNSLQSVDATEVPLSSDQHGQQSESKSAQQINVIEDAEDAVSSPTYRIAELRPPLEQKVELQDDEFNVGSLPDEDSESKSFQQIIVAEDAEDAISSPTCHIAELRPPLKQKVEQNDQCDVESLHIEQASSEPYSLMEVIQSPNHTDASSDFFKANLPSKPSVLEFLPQHDISEKVKEPSSSVLPSFGQLLEVSQINLDELPPLPPLPPMQWRIGKVQHASLASKRDLVGYNLDSFPPKLPSAADETTQLGEITQPSNPILPHSALRCENFQISDENIEGPLSMQVPTFGKAKNSEDYIPASVRTESTNPFLLLPTRHSESLEHGCPASEGGTSQPSVNPFSPVTNVEDAVSTYPSRSLPEELDHPLHQSASERSLEAEKLKGTFVLSEGKEMNPPEGGAAHPSVNPSSLATNLEDAVSTYPSHSLPEKLDHSLHQSAPERSSEDDSLQGSFVIPEGKVMNPPDTTLLPPVMLDDQPQHVFSTAEGQTAWSSGTSLPLLAFEDGQPNGSRQMKLPRPRNPLIDAVVAHDKSKLRKVTERVQPLIEQKIEERDSLLEQIRTKSFNLKPATLTRRSIQGPKTNLKVAAILEKANSIRQALAGSDEDEDADSWSDS